MTHEAPDFAADLLRGADEIASYLYGNANMRRNVYHLASTSNLPIFKLGSMICARKSILLRWIEQQEGRHTGETSRQA